VPDRGYVVADGDGDDIDQPIAGGHADEAGVVHSAVAGGGAGGGRSAGAEGTVHARRAAGAAQALAGDAADDLRRSGAVQRAVLEPDSALLFHGGRRADGQGRHFVGVGGGGVRV